MKKASLSYMGVFLGFMLIRLILGNNDNIKESILIFVAGYVVLILGIFAYCKFLKNKKSKRLD